MIWQLTKDKSWASIERQFSWVAEMKYVEQHKIHHAEGNVAIHTQMVLEEILKLSSFQNLDEQDKEILWAAALMHDIEKRSSSVI
ncbi:MAG: HD domain-containing protein [Dysgonomonas mossii]|uniref:HD domain-containing protein n=1 Tax=Dysgonomonas mossii TaxID=163665 RepID=UPI001DB0CB4F|nr:HD domain-containing protein [Dysgonomonas mossii]MBS5797581.1 HD domain-containing protein [Dysgonomonas mossii]MBS7111460.1 HD domain-containing protein [Dysgonomonas mossii]